MTCPECQQLLSPYLDHGLTADERQGVADHIAQCQTCTDVLRQFEQNRQVLHALPTAEVSSTMRQRLQRKVQSPKSTIHNPQSAIHNPQSAIAPWWRGWRALSVGTMATCAAAFLFYFVTVQTPPEVSAEEVVSSMEGLMNVLDPNDGELLLDPDSAEDPDPDWQQEIDGWFFDYETAQE